MLPLELEVKLDAGSEHPSQGALGRPLNLIAATEDADPDIPILKEAKAEYAKLQ